MKNGVSRDVEVCFIGIDKTGEDWYGMAFSTKRSSTREGHFFGECSDDEIGCGVGALRRHDDGREGTEVLLDKIR